VSFRDEVMAIPLQQYVTGKPRDAHYIQGEMLEIAARADARIAELVDLLTECRDCVASDINHTLAQFHEPAAVDYLHALLMRVDAAMAARANGGEG